MPPGVVEHVGDGERYLRSWFVVFEPPSADDAVALVAMAVETNRWRGAWTFDAEATSKVADFVRAKM